MKLKKIKLFTKIPDYSSEDYYGGLTGIYFNRVLNKIIEFGKLKCEKGIVLDFGCGIGKLKQRLTKYGVTIVGYDTLKKVSDVGNYKTVKPSKIVCNSVLEHLTEEEIENTVKNFIKTRAELIVSVPTENFISKIGMLVTGKLNYHADHKTKYKRINKIIERYYKIIRRRYVLTMNQITLYRLK